MFNVERGNLPPPFPFPISWQPNSPTKISNQVFFRSPRKLFCLRHSILALPFRTLTMDALLEPDVIAGAFDPLRVQSQRIANVGAIQNQQDILAAVQALGQQIHALGQQTNHRIDVMQQQMNQRFDTLENRQNNFEIAAVNARLVHADGAAIL